MEMRLVVEKKSVEELFKKIARKTSDMTPVFATVGDIVRSSIDRNFEVGGRYSDPDSVWGGTKKWIESARAKKQGGQTLIDSSRLVSATDVNASAKRVEIVNNTVYAAAHNFGVDKDVPIPEHSRSGKKRKKHTVKAHSRHMKLDARPFMVVQNEDMDEIEHTLARYLDA